MKKVFCLKLSNPLHTGFGIGNLFTFHSLVGGHIVPPSNPVLGLLIKIIFLQSVIPI